MYNSQNIQVCTVVSPKGSLAALLIFSLRSYYKIIIDVSQGDHALVVIFTIKCNGLYGNGSEIL